MLHTSLVLCLWTLIGVFGDEVKSVSVMEGHSVTLHTHLTHTHDVIQWRFGVNGPLIASIRRSVNNPTYYNNDKTEIFRDRLKMDSKTGDLTITDVTSQHSGLYQLLTVTSSQDITKIFSLTVNTHTAVSISESTQTPSSSSESSGVSEVHLTRQQSFHSLYKVVMTCVVGFLMTGAVVFIIWINRKSRKTHGQGTQHHCK
ncbi:uncharacterized protein LOC130549048 isoform X7 [Triplophysa rosa]|uniref:uncharacterized protein LOC130549048 isoform X7 n=1 Tax=Triplophysa rosa TaxID=992332 RepID=UPI00254604F8|nr:uncharacterized protein LOC130549048 isoform X7 [Triplophysa rosa]